MLRYKTDCCSIPRYGIKNFATLAKWASLMNEACCQHDQMYQRGFCQTHTGVIITARNRREADEWFYNQMLKIAKENEDRYGHLGYTAAKDMYTAVRKFGRWAWVRSTFSRLLT